MVAVRPHSIWNQTSIGLSLTQAGNAAMLKLAKFF
jgi:hypothetical protein